MDYLKFVALLALSAATLGAHQGAATGEYEEYGLKYGVYASDDTPDEGGLEHCPVEVNCTKVHGKVALEDVDHCNNGFYCVCDDDLGYAVLEQCPYNSLFSPDRQKFNPDTLECVAARSFNCWKWLNVKPDDSLLCPTAVDCALELSGIKIPIAQQDQCDDGYYCECDAAGMAFRKQCPFDSLFSVTHQKLDPTTRRCVRSDKVDCAEWIANPGGLDEPLPTLPSSECPVDVDCKAHPKGEKVPIPLQRECDEGYFCECDASGVAKRGHCPFNGVLSFKLQKLDANTLRCVKRKSFDCSKWISGLTSTPAPSLPPTPPTTTAAPVTATPPSTTTNVPAPGPQTTSSSHTRPTPVTAGSAPAALAAALWCLPIAILGGASLL